MSILVIGSVNVDTTYNLENFPKPGETISSLSKSRSVGGKGANQAIACQKLGGDVKFLACVGNDMDADFIFENIPKIHSFNIFYLSSTLSQSTFTISCILSLTNKPIT